MDDSSITVLGALFLIAMTIMTWSVQRRYALIPLLITTCYMPLGQMFIVAGLHFHLFRVLLLVGMIRVLTRREHVGLKMTYPDKLFMYWCAVTLIVGTLTEGTFDRFINRSGDVFSAAGSYYLFRCWIRNLDDVRGVLRFLGWMILPLALSMLIEKFTTRNVFYIFGGVPPITAERDGTLRCQGAFRHPILAGTYGATLFPFFVGLWYQGGKNKRPAAVGMFSSFVATMAAGSSGALLALMGALAGFGLWRIRNRMKTFRWVVILGVAVLALVMNAPVWYVIARVSELSGGSGWHRSYVIDQAIRHFNEWWLVGSTYTAHWAAGGQVLPTDPRNMDITNQYVSEGLAGGIWKLLLFVIIIIQGFKTVGRWIKRPDIPGSEKFLIWSVGVALASHCISFISVTYYDQIVIMWYWLLAMLSMLAMSSVWMARVRPPQMVEPVVGKAHSLAAIGI